MLEVSWFLFTVASLPLIVTPGQDMVLVMSRSKLAFEPKS